MRRGRLLQDAVADREVLQCDDAVQVAVVLYKTDELKMVVVGCNLCIAVVRRSACGVWQGVGVAVVCGW